MTTMFASIAGAFFFFAAGLVAMALKRGLLFGPASTTRAELERATLDAATWRSRAEDAIRDANTWRARAEVATQEKAMWQARAEAAEAAAEAVAEFKPEITKRSDDTALHACIVRLENEIAALRCERDAALGRRLRSTTLQNAPRS